MNKMFKYFMLALVATVGFGLTACDDDDTTVARAVLASANSLSYDATGADEQLITVYSDATWTCEHPDWVVVTPETGSGTTTVSITVLDNVRDGAQDNPRKAEVVFKGVTKASEAHVVIRQGGDTFRDVAPISISDMESNEEESVAIIKNLTVTHLLADGFMATDGQKNIKVTNNSTATVGQTLTVYGTKGIDGNRMSYVVCDHVTAEGTAKTLPAAVDITDDIDTYSATTRAYVSLTGKLSGSNISVPDATNHGVITLAEGTGINAADLNGHRVTVKGYYAGTASPAVNIVVTEAEDLGIVETIYWSEDWEWFTPWVAAAGNTVGTDNPSADSPQLRNCKVGDQTLLQEMLDRGYELEVANGKNDPYTTENPVASIYANQNYLKFGKTDYQGSITMPVGFEKPADSNGIIFQFDWCSQRQGSGTWDATEVSIYLINGEEETLIETIVSPFAKDEAYRWITVSIDLSTYKIDKNTKIKMRNSDAQYGKKSAKRWFIDNLKIKEKD